MVIEKNPEVYETSTIADSIKYLPSTDWMKSDKCYEGLSSYCYLMKIQGASEKTYPEYKKNPYCISLISEYKTEDGFSHEDVKDRGIEVDKLLKTESIPGRVFVGAEENADVQDEMIVIMPADIDKDKFLRVADMLKNTAYNRNIKYEDYKENNFPVFIESSEKKETDLIVKKALYCTDTDATAEKMAEILMDDGVSTYKVFEDLASAYLKASHDKKEGMDMALSCLCGCNMKELAEVMIESAKEKLWNKLNGGIKNGIKYLYLRKTGKG